MRDALMGHCVQGVALHRPMACSSYAHSTQLRARELQSYVHLYKAITEHIIKRPTTQAHAIKDPKGPQKSVLGPWGMANGECVENWGSVLQHLGTCDNQ